MTMINCVTKHRGNKFEVLGFEIERIHPKDGKTELTPLEAIEWFRDGYCIDPENGDHYRLMKMKIKYENGHVSSSWANQVWKWDKERTKITRVRFLNSGNIFAEIEYGCPHCGQEERIADLSTCPSMYHRTIA